jgi:hypothetical protein
LLRLELVSPEQAQADRPSKQENIGGNAYGERRKAGDKFGKWRHCCCPYLDRHLFFPSWGAAGGTRPSAEAYLEEHAVPQQIEARLWQDPIGAVDESRQKSGAWEADQDCKFNPGLEAGHFKLPLNTAHHPMVLGVTVSGAPYPEDVERRRRTRYAVLAGLERAGFAPEDRRHIGYFVWRQPSFPAPPLFEKPPSKLPLLACYLPSAQGFTCVSTALARIAPELPLLSLFWFQTFVFRRKEALAVLLANRLTP